MIVLIRKNIFIASLILLLGLFFTTKVKAATLTNASDLITTSRPSAAAPIIPFSGSLQLATDTQVNIVSLNTPTAYNSPSFLASDSAVLLNDVGQSLSTVIIASESAVDKPSPNQQILYFTSQVGATHHAGTTIYSSVTATHTISFKTQTAIPIGGKIVITFPGTGSNIASPSATTFSFNNLASSDIQINGFGSTTCSWTIQAPNITCTTATAIINANTQLTIILGCTSQSGGTCTSFRPRLVNPTKGPNAPGTADIWKISISTQDTNGITLDQASVKIATVEAVTVQGIVEPYLTFTVAGTTGTVCGDTINSGIASTATFVDLGSLGPGLVSINGQRLTVNTNATNGYSITATSSGHFINPGNGIFLPDANDQGASAGLTGNSTTNGTVPAPASIVANTPAFGIHPCAVSGSPAPTIPSGWGTGGGSNNKYANPWNTGTNGFYAYLASTNAPSASSITDIEYAAAAAATTPSGIYFNYFTYVATPTF